MLSILAALFIGWVLHFVHLDSLFHNLVGFTSEQYYLTWLVLGITLWIKRVFNK